MNGYLKQSGKPERFKANGFMTYALTNEKGKILVENSSHTVNLQTQNEVKANGDLFYWSLVYLDGNKTWVMENGVSLGMITPEKFNKLHKQSKINLYGVEKE